MNVFALCCFVLVAPHFCKELSKLCRPKCPCGLSFFLFCFFLHCRCRCLFSVRPLCPMSVFDALPSGHGSAASSAQVTAQLATAFVEAYYHTLSNDPATLYTFYVRHTTAQQQKKHEGRTKRTGRCGSLLLCARHSCLRCLCGLCAVCLPLLPLCSALLCCCRRMIRHWSASVLPLREKSSMQRRRSDNWPSMRRSPASTMREARSDKTHRHVALSSSPSSLPLECAAEDNTHVI
jgi:hypothetical protein